MDSGLHRGAHPKRGRRASFLSPGRLQQRRGAAERPFPCTAAAAPLLQQSREMNGSPRTGHVAAPHGAAPPSRAKRVSAQGRRRRGSSLSPGRRGTGGGGAPGRAWASTIPSLPAAFHAPPRGLGADGVAPPLPRCWGPLAAAGSRTCQSFEEFGEGASWRRGGESRQGD